MMMVLKQFQLVIFSFLMVAVANAKPIEVTILADDAYPPYSYLENGKIVGLYVELVAKAAKLLLPEYKVSFKAVPWKRGLQSLEYGTAFALLPPYKHFEKRPYIGSYSLPFWTEYTALFCQKQIDINGVLNEPDKKIEKSILVARNASFLILNDILQRAVKSGAIRLIENKSTRANILKLVNNRADCYINDYLSTKWEVDHMKQDGLKVDFSNIKIINNTRQDTVHIGYVKDEDDKYPFKQDFIQKMDKALQQVLQQEDSGALYQKEKTDKLSALSLYGVKLVSVK